MTIYTGNITGSPEDGGNIIEYSFPIERVIVGHDLSNIRIISGVKHIRKVRSHYMQLGEINAYITAQFPAAGSYVLDGTPEVTRWDSGVDLWMVEAVGYYISKT